MHYKDLSSIYNEGLNILHSCGLKPSFFTSKPSFGGGSATLKGQSEKNNNKKNKKLGFRPLGGRTTPMGHGGVSATPIGHGGGSVTPRPKATPILALGVAEPPSRAMEVVWPPPKLALSHPYNFILLLLLFLNIYIWGPSVTILMVARVADVKCVSFEQKNERRYHLCLLP
jgi:hypothetical protein